MRSQGAEPLINVLYVDDDVTLVRLVQKALGRRGYEVAHAANGAEASALIAKGSIDVIALDHYLTTGTGLDFWLNSPERITRLQWCTSRGRRK